MTATVRPGSFLTLHYRLAAGDGTGGAAALASIRTWVSINLVLGVLVVAATLLLV